MGVTWDEKPAKKRQTKLTGLHIQELSVVDRPANVDCVISTIRKRADPQPAPVKVDPEKQRDALAALDRLIAKSRAAVSPPAQSLDEVLAKAFPAQRKAALDSLEAMVAKRMDVTGCSSVEAWDFFAKTEGDLYARAINGGS